MRGLIIFIITLLKHPFKKKIIPKIGNYWLFTVFEMIAFPEFLSNIWMVTDSPGLGCIYPPNELTAKQSVQLNRASSPGLNDGAQVYVPSS